MNNLIEFPSNLYKYDFSVPGIFNRDEETSVNDQSNHFPEITYYLNDNEINGIFGSEIDSLRLDWLDVAMAAYLADRLSKRETGKQNNNSWKRKFEIKIAVRNPEIWTGEEINSELKNVLNYFTDDEWEFDFIKLTGKERAKEIQPKLPLPLQSKPRVALFSGGLDSFAGAAQELFNDFESPFIFISGATNTRQISKQRNQIKELIKIFPKREVVHHIVGFGIHWNKSEHPKEEDTQRTRGFLFVSLGAVTALNAGVNCLEIYENGIGAINLPYDASQLGTMSSRAVNPLSLLRMENFIEILTGQKFQIKNPYLFQTKGEMCQHDIVRKFAQITEQTFSCDGFPVRTAGKPQCGICTSCLLRRLSLESADLSSFDKGEGYLTDLNKSNSTASFNQLNDLRAMEWQYQIISKCLAEENPWEALIIEYPSLQTIVSELVVYREFQESELQKKILALYVKYCDEWTSFSARQNYFLIKNRAA